MNNLMSAWAGHEEGRTDLQAYIGLVPRGRLLRVCVCCVCDGQWFVGVGTFFSLLARERSQHATSIVITSGTKLSVYHHDFLRHTAANKKIQ